MEKCLNLCRVFTELGETLLERICTMPGEGLGDLTTVNLVMDGLRHYDWEVSRITFNFWYRLCETLQQNESTVDRFGYLFESLLKARVRNFWLHLAPPGFELQKNNVSTNQNAGFGGAGAGARKFQLELEPGNF